MALSSFGIRGDHDQLSPIHILSVVTLFSIPYAIWSRRRSKIRGHAITMISTFLGLLTAGAFTLMPWRVTHKVVFGG